MAAVRQKQQCNPQGFAAVLGEGAVLTLTPHSAGPAGLPKPHNV